MACTRPGYLQRIVTSTVFRPRSRREAIEAPEVIVKTSMGRVEETGVQALDTRTAIRHNEYMGHLF